MGNFFYHLIRDGGRPIVATCAKGFFAGREHVPRESGFVLASNHSGYLDVMCLVLATPRRIRFVTLHELMARPLLGAFIRGMRAIPVSRGASDAASVLPLVRALRAGEVVGIFPEAGIRPLADSVLTGGEFHPGAIRLALLGRVPVVPVAVLDAERFNRVTAWLPLRRRTQFAVVFGVPLHPDPEASEAELAGRMAGSFRALYRTALTLPGYQSGMR